MLQDSPGGLANVVRHARASNRSIRIRLDEETGALSVEVEDDGRGIRDNDRAGVGMSSTRADRRAWRLGAQQLPWQEAAPWSGRFCPSGPQKTPR